MKIKKVDFSIFFSFFVEIKRKIIYNYINKI